MRLYHGQHVATQTTAQRTRQDREGERATIPAGSKAQRYGHLINHTAYKVGRQYAERRK